MDGNFILLRVHASGILIHSCFHCDTASPPCNVENLHGLNNHLQVFEFPLGYHYKNKHITDHIAPLSSWVEYLLPSDEKPVSRVNKYKHWDIAPS